VANALSLQHGAGITGPRVASSLSISLTLDYLRSTGRSVEVLQLVEDYCKRQRLWFEPDAEPRYTEVVEIDLSSVEISLAGPRRPQDRCRRARPLLR